MGARAAEVETQGATLTARLRTAVCLGHRDQQGVELVEQGGIRRQVTLQERPRVLIAHAGAEEPMARQHPAGVGVGHKHRSPRRIEENGIRGLRPHALHREKPLAKGAERPPTHRAPTPRLPDQPAGEGAEPPGLQAVAPGRSDEVGERRRRQGQEALGPQEAPGPERLHRSCRIRPGGVLRQDRSHRDLEGAPGGPPALGAEPGKQGAVEAQEPPPDGIGSPRLPAGALPPLAGR